MALIDRAKALQESAGKIAVQNAQLLKALQPAKLTGDERYIELLRIVENKLQNGQKPTLTELSNANIAGQMLSKPRSYFDQASGQMVTQAATDPSKAFPLAYKQMGDTTEGGATTTPKPTVQQATVGNIPSGSQKDIADIDANLRKLELSAPELQSFLGSLKSGEVKYNATSNTLDLLGATVLPAFGLNEQGGQVKKDEINFSRDEIMAVVSLSEKEGSIHSKESVLIENLFKLKNIKTKEIMTPRSVVFALQADVTVEEAIEDDKMYIHSRIPIYNESIDDIIGVVFNQTILEESVEDRDTTLLRNITVPVHKISENVPVSVLIDLFVKRKTHLFIVHDNYGQTSGVVTLEDAIETLLGVEIVDEMDEVEDMQAFAKDKSKQFQDKLLVEKKRLQKLDLSKQI
jgi:Mg2+/Co2+ transporter CorC